MIMNLNLRLAVIMCIATVSVFSSGAVRMKSLINDGWLFSSMAHPQPVQVHLPHSWNVDAYSVKDYYRGKGHYSRSLRLPEYFLPGRLFLKFDGVASSATVSIDGKEIGTVVGAYSSHTFDITPFVSPGKDHSLSVIADNSRKDIPPYSADFTFMGGLYRDVWLISVPDVHLDIVNGNEEGFSVLTKVLADGSWSVEVAGSVVNHSDSKEDVVVRMTVADVEGHTVASATGNLSVPSAQSKSFCFNTPPVKDISLWTPEHPALYKVSVEVLKSDEVIDSGACTTAFRTFGFDDDGRFLLNGSPYKLRGICRHQDRRPMGIALLDEQHRQDMRIAKDMGANFVRISHYPQDDAVLEMCDRLGLIVWEEIPVIDFVPDTPGFDDNCERMLRDMIRRHRNHPSIAMWGYMNEILLRVPSDGREETLARTRALADRLETVVREEDPDRLSTMAFHGSDVYHDADMAEITDVKGWNLYQGWYGGHLGEFEEFLSRQHREHPGHKIIVSEYGAGSDLRLHSFDPQPFDFSMEYQQKFLEHYLPIIEDSAFVAGASHWNLIDFSSANRQESMPHINNKGILTNDRRKKDIFYYFSSMWHDIENDTIVHIAVEDWKERTDILSEDGDAVHPVKIYTNLPSISLSLNGIHLGVNEASNRTIVFNAPLKEGKNSFVASDPDSGKVYDTAEVFLEGIPVYDARLMLGSKELGVNVGSNCWFHSDDTGFSWLPDREYKVGEGFGYIGGRKESTTSEILLTSDDPMLQSCRKDLSEYRFDVQPGEYEVELLFAELATPNENSAYLLGVDNGVGDSEWTNMDIVINGVTVEEAFSPGVFPSGRDSQLVLPCVSEEYNSVGCPPEGKFLVRRRYNVSAPDGVVRIGFDRAKGSTHLSAVKIRSL